MDTEELARPAADHVRRSTITLPATHNGPIGSGHGGVTAGRLSALFDGAAMAVRFHRPVPLERALTVTGDREGGDVERVDTGELIATVRSCPDGLPDPPASLLALRNEPDDSFDAIPALSDHPCPTCLACGPVRADGLRLLPRRLGDRCRTIWRTGPDAVPDWLAWAALDCSSAAPALAGLDRDEAILTGELAAEIRRAIPTDTNLHLSARLRAREGRRLHTEVVLHDGDVIVAVARATWVRVPRSMLLRLADGAAS